MKPFQSKLVLCLILPFLSIYVNGQKTTTPAVKVKAEKYELVDDYSKSHLRLNGMFSYKKMMGSGDSLEILVGTVTEFTANGKKIELKTDSLSVEEGKAVIHTKDYGNLRLGLDDRQQLSKLFLMPTQKQKLLEFVGK